MSDINPVIGVVGRKQQNWVDRYHIWGTQVPGKTGFDMWFRSESEAKLAAREHAVTHQCAVGVIKLVCAFNKDTDEIDPSAIDLRPHVGACEHCKEHLR